MDSIVFIVSHLIKRRRTMTEDRVSCGICKEEFRPIRSHIKLVCNGCYDKNNVAEFLSKKILIPFIAKIIEKETNEEYCSSEIIAELIHDKLKEKWEEKKDV